MKQPDNSKPNSDFASADVTGYIRTRIQMLCELFNRKQTDALVGVFQNLLCNVPINTIRKAFDRCEAELDRFPTPKQVMAICDTERPSEAWRYDYKERDGQDPETGKPIRVRIDPSAVGGERILYRPQDCPEGRLFLLKLRSLARKQQ